MTALHQAALAASEPIDLNYEALVDIVAAAMLEQELQLRNDFGIFFKILWGISSIFKYRPIGYSSTARIAVYLTQQDMEKRNERS